MGVLDEGAEIQVSTDNEFLPDGNQQESGGQLRKKLEETLNLLKKRDKEYEELQAEVSKKSLDAVFTELGVPEKARALYKGDVDKPAVEKWLADYADVLRLPTPAASEQEQLQRSVQRADSLGEDANLPSEDAWREEAAKVARTSPNRDPAALEKFLASAGLRRGELTPPQMG